MENKEKEKLIKEIKEKFNFYVPGDMKKLTKFLKAKGLDVVSITHNPNYQGLASAVTTVEFWNNNGDSDILTDTLKIIWG